MCLEEYQAHADISDAMIAFPYVPIGCLSLKGVSAMPAMPAMSPR